MNPHQRAKVKYWNEQKLVMHKSEALSRSQEINAIWTFETEFPIILNKQAWRKQFSIGRVFGKSIFTSGTAANGQAPQS